MYQSLQAVKQTCANYSAVIPTNNFPKSIFTGDEQKTPLQLRYQICALEYELKQAIIRGKLQEVEFPLFHKFEDGQYHRTIFLPAGSVVVGKLHKFAHYNKIHEGKVLVVTEQGGLQLLEGPCDMISPAACKRALMVLEDTYWTVVHDTQSTNLMEIEEKVIAKNYTQIGLEDPELLYITT